MSRTALKLTAAATALLAGGLGLAACTDSGSDTASAESTRAAGITDGSGEWSASVDGTPIEIDDATVVCAEQGDSISLSIASTSMTEATGLSAVLGTGDSPEVQAVGMGSTETGEALAYAPGGARQRGHRHPRRRHLHRQRHPHRRRHEQPDGRPAGEVLRTGGHLPLIRPTPAPALGRGL